MSDDEWERDAARVWWGDASAVLHFGWSMWKKLRANRHKAHWRDKGDFLFFRSRIDDELLELENATSPSEQMEECADVGNFAMMIHEQARLRP